MKRELIIIMWKTIVFVTLGLLLAVGVAIVFGLLLDFNKKPKVDDIYLDEFKVWNITGNFSHPREITFSADYIVFTNGTMNLTFGEGYFFSFDNFDKLVWNIGNETYIYERRRRNEK